MAAWLPAGAETAIPLPGAVEETDFKAPDAALWRRSIAIPPLKPMSTTTRSGTILPGLLDRGVLEGGILDAVVVGAGLSGLICARTLRRAGLRVGLLEARDRLGGRMHRRATAAGIPVDLGGQWVGASHHRLLALLDEFGLRRYPTFYGGSGVFLWDGLAHQAGVEHDFAASLLFFKPAELGVPWAEVDQAVEIQRRFQQLVAQVPLQPLGHPGGGGPRPHHGGPVAGAAGRRRAGGLSAGLAHPHGRLRRLRTP